MGNDKTKWIFDENDDAGDDTDGVFTESIDNFGNDPTLYGNDANTTRLMQTSEKTEIYHSGKLDKFSSEVDVSTMIDPVVGWLVVVKGPGLGQSISLGAGMNSIGRDPDERAALPFGDTLISQKDHARIIYDDDDRTFYIAHGSGKNITKVDGKMVANVLPLRNFAQIELSKVTALKFVAFCQEEFDWADLANTGTQSK